MYIIQRYEKKRRIQQLQSASSSVHQGFTTLSFLASTKDFSVSVFDMVIRLLGGLLSSYHLSQEKCLLDLAEDLGNRILPAWTTNSTSGCVVLISNCWFIVVFVWFIAVGC